MKSLYLSLLLASFVTPALAAPQIIAHRAGTADAPENTLPAIHLALANKADAVWVTVQISQDGVPVLYRPSDLSTLTSSIGPVSGMKARQLTQLNTGEKWRKDGQKWEGTATTLPTLQSALEAFPKAFFYLDLKSPDADPATQGKQLMSVLKQTKSLARVRVYSTEDKYLEALPAQIPRFVSRTQTRTLLANVSLTHQCPLNEDKNQDLWFGLELARKVEVVEKFTLGEGVSPATLTWDKEAMDCFRAQGQSEVILFGINKPEEYQQAVNLGADGVMVNSPAAFRSYLAQK